MGVEPLVDESGVELLEWRRSGTSASEVGDARVVEMDRPGDLMKERDGMVGAEVVVRVGLEMGFTKTGPAVAAVVAAEGKRSGAL